nr:minichromosome maintenance complex component 3-like protein [Cryptomonas paramecium]
MFIKKKSISLFLIFIHVFFIKFKFSRFYKKVKRLSTTIILSINAIWNLSSFFAENIMKKPLTYIPMIEIYLTKLYSKLNQKHEKKIKIIFDLKKSFREKFTFPGLLDTRFIGEIVFLEGLVMYCSKIKIKIDRPVYSRPGFFKLLIPKKNASLCNFFYMDYMKFNKKNNLQLNETFSKFIDHQDIIIQHFNFNLIQDCFSENTHIFLHGKLVNSCKIGQKIKLYGIYNLINGIKSNSSKTIYNSTILCLSISLIKENYQYMCSKPDLFLLKNFSFLVDNFYRISCMIIPDIFKKNLTKQGLLLFLIAKGKQQNISILLEGNFDIHKNLFFNFVNEIFPETTVMIYKNFLFGKIKSSNSKKNIHLERENVIFDRFIINNKIICIDNLEMLTYTDKYTLGKILDCHKTLVSTRFFNVKSEYKIIAFIKSSFDNSSFGKYNYLNFDTQKSVLFKFDLIFFSVDQINEKQDKNFAFYTINQNFKIKKKNILYQNSKANFFSKIKSVSFEFLRLIINFSKHIVFFCLENKAIDYILKNYVQLKSLRKKINFNYIESLLKLIVCYVKINFRSIATKKDAWYMNTYLLKLARLNRVNFLKKKEKIKIFRKKKLKRNDFEKYYNLKKYLYFLHVNSIFISKKYYLSSKFGFVFDFRVNSFDVKGLIKINSLFERIVCKFLKAKYCLIFKNFLIRMNS